MAVKSAVATLAARADRLRDERGAATRRDLTETGWRQPLADAAAETERQFEMAARRGFATRVRR